MEDVILEPPALERTSGGDINPSSLANLLVWFLDHDQKVGIVRHPAVEELFDWKQANDSAIGAKVYPFENAEARFAVGVFQALAENNSQEKLQQWITDVLNALQAAKQMNSQISTSYKLNDEEGNSHLEKADLIPTRAERQIYLSSCWIESLCTAEARFLGWVYQILYGKPFQPSA
jgi:hypothetical protein